MKPIEKAADALGGYTELATACGVGRGRVWNWVNRDKKLPLEFCEAIEVATKGEVTAHQLRPDFFKRDSAAA